MHHPTDRITHTTAFVTPVREKIDFTYKQHHLTTASLSRDNHLKPCQQEMEGRKEGNVLFNDALNTFYLRLYGRKEGNVLFNNTLNTFYLRLYGVRDMVKGPF